MKFLSTLLIAATAVCAQEIGNSDGGSTVAGSTGVDNTNVNSGWQAEGAQFNDGTNSGNGFSNIFGSSFSNVNSNSFSKGNIANNPSQTSLSGNQGSTANGANNLIGDNFGPSAIPFAFGPGFAPAFAAVGPPTFTGGAFDYPAFAKRDVIVNGGYPSYPGYPGFVGVPAHKGGVVFNNWMGYPHGHAQVFAVPEYAPVERVRFGAYPHAHAVPVAGVPAHHNEATIIQNSV